MNQKELVFFRGGKENVSIQLDDGADFQQVLHRLEEKLEAGAMLVSGNKLKLELGERNLQDTQKDSLKKVFSSKGLPDPFATPEIQSEHAGTQTEDIFVKTEREDEEVHAYEEISSNDDSGNKTSETKETAQTEDANGKTEEASDVAVTAPEEDEEKPVAAAEEKKLPPEERTLMVKKTLRSGQSVEYDGNVVILGDVNPGAEVNAGGDILIMGALRGTVHAGCNGDKKAIIAALKVMPVQARIANITAAIPAATTPQEHLPQVLSVQNDKIKLEKLK